MSKKIHGVDIPSSIVGDEERSKAYAAGWHYYRNSKKLERIPEDLRNVGAEYRSDTTRSSLEVPQVTRVESSYWAGYLTSASAGRDRTRANSRETDSLDLTNELKGVGRHRISELREMFHEND